MSGHRAKYVVDVHCTTTQPKTHNTVALLVYPWHPWHGKTVEVREAQVRRGCSIFRCILDGTENSKAFEIPAWMFNRTTCWAQDLSVQPFVSTKALRELREFLCRASASVEIQYSSFVPQGDADATDPNHTTATVALSSSGENSQLGAAHSRCTTKSHLQTGGDASAASRQQHSRREGDQP